MKINKRQPIHWQPVREERNRLLAITDNYMLPDRLTPEQLEELAGYRKDLRDITTYESTSTVVWPTPPSFVKELQNVGN